MRPLSAALVAFCLLVIAGYAILAVVSDPSGGALSGAIAREIAMNHTRNLDAEFTVETVEGLGRVMPRLGFNPTLPAEVRKLSLRFTGARYCSIQGNLAVQIRFMDRLGRRFTLYQTPSVAPLTDLAPADFVYAGLQMKLWQERGLFMGLACMEGMGDMDG